MHGKSVCYHHGGRTPSGFGLPQTRTGKYSKVLPVRLAARYAEAKDHPDLLSLRDDLAACESRLAELFQRLDTGESGEVWRALRKALDAFEAALAGGDRQAMHAALGNLRTLITRGTSDYAVWSDVREMWQARCRLTETEQRTLLMQQQVVTVEQLGTLLAQVTHAIQQRVTTYAEPDTARAILGALSTDLARLSTVENGPRPRPYDDA